MPSRAEALGVSEKWHRAYHGTRHEALEKILQVGELSMPGEQDRIYITLTRAIYLEKSKLR